MPFHPELAGAANRRHGTDRPKNMSRFCHLQTLLASTPQELFGQVVSWGLECGLNIRNFGKEEKWISKLFSNRLLARISKSIFKEAKPELESIEIHPRLLTCKKGLMQINRSWVMSMLEIIQFRPKIADTWIQQNTGAKQSWSPHAWEITWQVLSRHFDIEMEDICCSDRTNTQAVIFNVRSTYYR